MQTSEVDQLAVGPVKPEGLASVLLAGPLEEAVCRNHAAPVLERLSKAAGRLDCLSPGIDVLEGSRAIGHPEVDETPPCRQGFTVFEAISDDRVGVCWSDVIAGPV